LLEWYTQEEWEAMDAHLDHFKDELYSYAAIEQLVEKYMVRNRSTNQVYETPQVRYMVAAATAFNAEPHNRLKYIKEYYDCASDGMFTLATPVLAGLGAQIQSSIQKYRNAISGTAYSEQEGRDIASIFPSITKGQVLNNTLVKAQIDGLNSDVAGLYTSVLGKNIYDNLSNPTSTEKFDLQSVLNGTKAETDAEVKAGTMTPEQASQKVYEAVRDARIHNESLTKVGGDTNQASKGIVAGYDIKSYATDPQHEVKIASIYQRIPDMNTANAVNSYINQVARNSPVTGQAVIAAAQKYNVDPKMILAMMMQDSSLGTAGKAVRTRNPGNVGNDDTGALRTYPTWDDGVMAVAKNLEWRKVA